MASAARPVPAGGNSVIPDKARNLARPAGSLSRQPRHQGPANGTPFVSDPHQACSIDQLGARSAAYLAASGHTPDSADRGARLTHESRPFITPRA